MHEVGFVGIQVLVPFLHEQMVVLVFDALVLILRLQGARGQHLYFADNSRLLVQNAVCNLLRPLVLNVVDLLVQDLSNVRIHFYPVHHLLVDGFVEKFTP